MDENQVEGVIREGVGRLQDGAGGVAGDAKIQLKGKANEVAGAAQRTFGDLKDKADGLVDTAQARAQDIYSAADQFAREQPLASVGVGVLIGLGVGILIGAQIVGQTRTVYFRR